jgi:hypothetical protein
MGGQACILYGAAEFSPDIDLAIMANPDNLSRLEKVLSVLKAESIAVPPFHQKYLKLGHAVHFRCMDPDVERIRIDIMSKMRGLDSFSKLWQRRTTVVLEEEFKEREKDRLYWKPLLKELEALRRNPSRIPI